MKTAEITVGTDGYKLRGIVGDSLWDALGALVDVEDHGGDMTNPAVVAQALDTALQQKGYDVRVRVAPKHVLRHRCGAVFTPSQWKALPAIKLPLDEEGISFLELKHCACRSTISLASMKLEAVQ